MIINSLPDAWQGKKGGTRGLNSRRRQRGFSLVEMLVVVVLLAIILPAMLSSFTASYLMVKETRLLEQAKHIGQVVMERALSDPYPQIISDRSAADDISASLANFRYSQSFSEADGRTTITVAVRYAL